MGAGPTDRSLNARAAARISWGKTRDRTARTAAARAAAEERFARLADPDGTLPPAERAAPPSNTAGRTCCSSRGSRSRRVVAGELPGGK